MGMSYSMPKNTSGEHQDKPTKQEHQDKQDRQDKILKPLNIYIPFRNRERSRLLKCISHVKKNCNFYDNIVVIDNSNEPIKPIKGVDILRIETKRWNKAFLLNQAIQKYVNTYLMTLDVDILLDDEHFLTIKKHMARNTFICDTNVRRIHKKDLSDNYDDMIMKSKPWRTQDVNQYLNTANGGFQVYSYEFWEYMNGIQESLGLYHGAVDNLVYYRARMCGLTIVDISHPLLHLEHKIQKGTYESEGERQLAYGYMTYKARYLDYMIRENIYKNPEIRSNKPSQYLFDTFKEVIENRDKLIQDAVARGDKEVTIGFETYKLKKAKPTIMVAVINNYGTLPDYFMYDVINLLTYSWGKGYEVVLQKVNACDVNSLRNVAINSALGLNEEKKEYDYFVALDVDHRYPADFLVDFVEKCEENNWEIITGLTSRKTPPYNATQYHKIKDDMNAKSNTVNQARPTKKEIREGKDIIEIEASGPVGMLIKTEVFRKIPYPWFEMEFSNGEIGVKGKKKIQNTQIGGDIHFCKLLKKYGYKIRLNRNYSFPHQLEEVFVDRGKLKEFNQKGHINL